MTTAGQMTDLMVARGPFERERTKGDLPDRHSHMPGRLGGKKTTEEGLRRMVQAVSQKGSERNYGGNVARGKGQEGEKEKNEQHLKAGWEAGKNM